MLTDQQNTSIDMQLELESEQRIEVVGILRF